LTSVSLHLFDYPNGMETGPGVHAVYDVARDTAYYGSGGVDGHALVWRIGGDGAGALLSATFDLDPDVSWLLRCDRVDFPPGAIAYTHIHPGPGIRCMIKGELGIDTRGTSHRYRPFEAWFETGPDPVYAPGSETEHSAFARVLLVPKEWQGRRTIRYVLPEDDDKPKNQYATVFFEEPLRL
jgi:hypothetical protein